MCLHHDSLEMKQVRHVLLLLRGSVKRVSYGPNDSAADAHLPEVEASLINQVQQEGHRKQLCLFPLSVMWMGEEFR